MTLPAHIIAQIATLPACPYLTGHGVDIRGAGNANKLLYGIDAMGNICGSVNEFNGTTLDLTSAKKLYFLDPFEVWQQASPPALPLPTRLIAALILVKVRFAACRPSTIVVPPLAECLMPVPPQRMSSPAVVSTLPP